MSENKRGTKWRNRKDPKRVADLYFHRPRTGRAALRVRKTVIWRGKLEDLKKGWEEIR